MNSFFSSAFLPIHTTFYESMWICLLIREKLSNLYEVTSYPVECLCGSLKVIPLSPLFIPWVPEPKNNKKKKTQGTLFNNLKNHCTDILRGRIRSIAIGSRRLLCWPKKLQGLLKSPHQLLMPPKDFLAEDNKQGGSNARYWKWIYSKHVFTMSW